MANEVFWLTLLHFALHLKYTQPALIKVTSATLIHVPDFRVIFNWWLYFKMVKILKSLNMIFYNLVGQQKFH